MSSGGWREIFEDRCMNCRRKLRIVITNEATEWWAGSVNAVTETYLL